MVLMSVSEGKTEMYAYSVSGTADGAWRWEVIDSEGETVAVGRSPSRDDAESAARGAAIRPGLVPEPAQTALA